MGPPLGFSIKSYQNLKNTPNFLQKKKKKKKKGRRRRRRRRRKNC
jgi:hypothetical protein